MAIASPELPADETAVAAFMAGRSIVATSNWKSRKELPRNDGDDDATNRTSPAASSAVFRLEARDRSHLIIWRKDYFLGQQSGSVHTTTQFFHLIRVASSACSCSDV